MSGRELFWLNDPANLFKRWTRFVPTNDMTVPEALNAVVRFTIYSSILISLITQKSTYLLLIPAVMVVSAILVRMYPETQVLREAFHSGSTGAATPKASNPFMNVLFTDYVDNPDRPAAPSNINNNAVKASIDEAFAKTSDLFMDTSDKYGLAQSARMWVTQAATTIPNDLEGYQKFLNRDNVSRKETSESFVVAKGSTSSPKGLL